MSQPPQNNNNFAAMQYMQHLHNMANQLPSTNTYPVHDDDDDDLPPPPGVRSDSSSPPPGPGRRRGSSSPPPPGPGLSYAGGAPTVNYSHGAPPSSVGAPMMNGPQSLRIDPNASVASSGQQWNPMTSHPNSNYPPSMMNPPNTMSGPLTSRFGQQPPAQQYPQQQYQQQQQFQQQQYQQQQPPQQQYPFTPQANMGPGNGSFGRPNPNIGAGLPNQMHQHPGQYATMQYPLPSQQPPSNMMSPMAQQTNLMSPMMQQPPSNMMSPIAQPQFNQQQAQQQQQSQQFGVQPNANPAVAANSRAFFSQRLQQPPQQQQQQQQFLPNQQVVAPSSPAGPAPMALSPYTHGSAGTVVTLRPLNSSADSSASNIHIASPTASQRSLNQHGSPAMTPKPVDLPPTPSALPPTPSTLPPTPSQSPSAPIGGSLSALAASHSRQTSHTAQEITTTAALTINTDNPTNAGSATATPTPRFQLNTGTNARAAMAAKRAALVSGNSIPEQSPQPSLSALPTPTAGTPLPSLANKNPAIVSHMPVALSADLLKPQLDDDDDDDDDVISQISPPRGGVTPAPLPKNNSAAFAFAVASPASKTTTYPTMVLNSPAPKSTTSSSASTTPSLNARTKMFTDFELERDNAQSIDASTLHSATSLRRVPQPTSEGRKNRQQMKEAMQLKQQNQDFYILQHKFNDLAEDYDDGDGATVETSVNPLADQGAAIVAAHTDAVLAASSSTSSVKQPVNSPYESNTVRRLGAASKSKLKNLFSRDSKDDNEDGPYNQGGMPYTNSENTTALKTVLHDPRKSTWVVTRPSKLQKAKKTWVYLCRHRYKMYWCDASDRKTSDQRHNAAHIHNICGGLRGCGSQRCNNYMYTQYARVLPGKQDEGCICDTFCNICEGCVENYTIHSVADILNMQVSNGASSNANHTTYRRNELTIALRDGTKLLWTFPDVYSRSVFVAQFYFLSFTTTHINNMHTRRLLYNERLRYHPRNDIIEGDFNVVYHGHAVDIDVQNETRHQLNTGLSDPKPATSTVEISPFVNPELVPLRDVSKTYPAPIITLRRLSPLFTLWLQLDFTNLNSFRQHFLYLHEVAETEMYGAGIIFHALFEYITSSRVFDILGINIYDDFDRISSLKFINNLPTYISTFDCPPDHLTLLGVLANTSTSTDHHRRPSATGRSTFNSSSLNFTPQSTGHKLSTAYEHPPKQPRFDSADDDDDDDAPPPPPPPLTSNRMSIDIPRDLDDDDDDESAPPPPPPPLLNDSQSFSVSQHGSSSLVLPPPAVQSNFNGSPFIPVESKPLVAASQPPGAGEGKLKEAPPNQTYVPALSTVFFSLQDEEINPQFVLMQQALLRHICQTVYSQKDSMGRLFPSSLRFALTQRNDVVLRIAGLLHGYGLFSPSIGRITLSLPQSTVQQFILDATANVIAHETLFPLIPQLIGYPVTSADDSIVLRETDTFSFQSRGTLVNTNNSQRALLPSVRRKQQQLLEQQQLVDQENKIQQLSVSSVTNPTNPTDVEDPAHIPVYATSSLHGDLSFPASLFPDTLPLLTTPPIFVPPALTIFSSTWNAGAKAVPKPELLQEWLSGNAPAQVDGIRAQRASHARFYQDDLFTEDHLYDRHRGQGVMLSENVIGAIGSDIIIIGFQENKALEVWVTAINKFLNDPSQQQMALERSQQQCKIHQDYVANLPAQKRADLYAQQRTSPDQSNLALAGMMPDVTIIDKNNVVDDDQWDSDQEEEHEIEDGDDEPSMPRDTSSLANSSSNISSLNTATASSDKKANKFSVFFKKDKEKGGGLATPSHSVGNVTPHLASSALDNDSNNALEHARDRSGANTNTAVAKNASLSYDLVVHKTFWEMGLCIWVRHDIAHLVGETHIETVALGIGNVIGLKGAIGAHITIANTPLLCITSHLAAREERMEQRNLNYQRILQELTTKLSSRLLNVVEMSNAPTTSSLAAGRSTVANPCSSTIASTIAIRDILSSVEAVIWIGDLNYRNICPFNEAVALCKSHNLTPLAACDQLTFERRAWRVFVGFEEGPLNFTPTYRWNRGECSFSNKRAQPPSWTDRILYRRTKKDTLDLLAYGARHSCTVSDHRPVVASFAFIPTGFNTYDTTPLVNNQRLIQQHSTPRTLRQLSQITANLRFFNPVPRNSTTPLKVSQLLQQLVPQISSAHDRTILQSCGCIGDCMCQEKFPLPLRPEEMDEQVSKIIVDTCPVFDIELVDMTFIPLSIVPIAKPEKKKGGGAKDDAAGAQGRGRKATVAGPGSSGLARDESSFSDTSVTDAAYTINEAFSGFGMNLPPPATPQNRPSGRFSTYTAPTPSSSGSGQYAPVGGVSLQLKPSQEQQTKDTSHTTGYTFDTNAAPTTQPNVPLSPVEALCIADQSSGVLTTTHTQTYPTLSIANIIEVFEVHCKFTRNPSRSVLSVLLPFFNVRAQQNIFTSPLSHFSDTCVVNSHDFFGSAGAQAAAAQLNGRRGHIAFVFTHPYSNKIAVSPPVIPTLHLVSAHSLTRTSALTVPGVGTDAQSFSPMLGSASFDIQQDPGLLSPSTRRQTLNTASKQMQTALFQTQQHIHDLKGHNRSRSGTFAGGAKNATANSSTTVDKSTVSLYTNPNNTRTVTQTTVREFAANTVTFYPVGQHNYIHTDCSDILALASTSIQVAITATANTTKSFGKKVQSDVIGYANIALKTAARAYALAIRMRENQNHQDAQVDPLIVPVCDNGGMLIGIMRVGVRILRNDRGELS